MKRIIFFDGVCTLCNGFVDFILKKDQKNSFLFSSLQSNYALKTVPLQNQGLDSVVLMEDNKVYTGATAVLRILFELGGAWNLLSVLLSIFPMWFQNLSYRFVANNRYRIFGKKNTCRLPTEAEKNRFLE